MNYIWFMVPGPFLSGYQASMPSVPATPDFSEPFPTIFPPKNEERPETAQKAIELDEPLVLDRQDLLEAGYGSHMKMWTEQEDKLLLYYREKKDLDWDEIATKIPDRNRKMCYSRYKRLKYNTNPIWRQKDEQKLLELIEEHGEDWETIGKHLKQWHPKQIRDHYLNHLRPGLVNAEWTLEEDLQLIRFLNEHGKNWSEAQRILKGRSLHKIKNRYYGRLKKLNEKKLTQESLSTLPS